MALYDQDDMAGRLLTTLPRPWFSDAAKASGGTLWAVLEGFGVGHAQFYQIIQTLKANDRLLTTLDLGVLQQFAQDFFGPDGFPPMSGELLNAYRSRIRAHFFIPGGTRQAIITAVTNLTGKAPISIVEPWNPNDCGAWDVGNTGWDIEGHWGSLDIPWEGFVQVERPLAAVNNGQPVYSAWDGYAGFDTDLAYYTDNLSSQIISDAVIYAAIQAAKAYGTEVWVQLQ